MLNDSLDTEMLQQFIASDASAPVIAPVVASASLERLPSPSGTLTAVSPVSLVATASVLEVDGGGVRTLRKVSFKSLTRQLLLRLV